MEAPLPSDTFEVVGELRLDGSPADSGTVTLHRVAPDDAGPVDSVSVDPSGGFSLTLPGPPRGGGGAVPEEPEGALQPGGAVDPGPAPAAGEIYFASVRHEGILYYGPPLADPEHLDAPYVIDAYSSVPAAPEGESFRVARRQVLLQEVDGIWRVTDIFEVANDEERTFVGVDIDGVVWSHPLPEGARRFQVGEGDLPADQAIHIEGEVRVSSPMTPGLRLFVFQYELPRLGEGIPLGAPTDSLEVFLREPAPEVEIEGLERAEGVEVEPGATFRRLVGSELEPGTVEFEEVQNGVGTLRAEHLVVILTLLLAGVAVWVLLSPGARGEAPRPASAEESAASPPSGTVMEEIASLDEAYVAGRGPPEAEYQARRRELLSRLQSES